MLATKVDSIAANKSFVILLLITLTLPRSEAATENFLAKISFDRKVDNSTIDRKVDNSTSSEENKLQSGEDQQGDRKNFLSLSADCFKNSSIVLNLQTSEPFQGWLYTRDHQVRLYW
jgi:hypothetical protein